MKCMGNAYEACSNSATWIRHTQFSGSHPLCTKHAIEDSDFLEDNKTDLYWEKLDVR